MATHDEEVDPDLVNLVTRMHASRGMLAGVLIYLLQVRERELIAEVRAADYETRVAVEEELRRLRDMIAQMDTLRT